MKNTVAESFPARIFGSWRGIFIVGLMLAFASPPVMCQEEPELKIEVIAGEKQFFVNDGDTIELHGEPVIIRTQKNRTFDISSLQFEYPRDFGFKFEEDPWFRSWVLDGNNFVIMLFEFPGRYDLQRFSREMVRRFGKKNCRVEDRKIKLNTIELKGKRINVHLMGARLTFDLFPIALDDSKTYILAFQDTKTDSGSDSMEGLETIDLLSQSIKINK